MKAPNWIDIKRAPELDTDTSVGFRATVRETIHACPPEGSGLMPCCDLPPFEVPLTDRLTLDPALVTCPYASGVSR